MKISTIFWTLFLGLLLFLSFNYHSKAPAFTHRSQLWSDKAGYNVYLPFTLIYGANASKMPNSIDSLTGGGFSIDSEKNILHNKYTYGVAFMQMPFFLTAHFFSGIVGFESNGYSKIYNWAVDVSAVFYSVLALLILSKIFLKNYDKKSVYFGLAILFLGSNLFYYTIDETGMSHVYSFFLITVFLGILVKTDFLKVKTIKWVIFLGFVAALIILVRPLNVIILSAFLFWKTDNLAEISNRLKRIFQPKTLALLFTCFLVVWFPQMLYWKYSEGSYLHYSYGEEGFNWLNPQLVKVWFSPNSGAFLYGSISLVILIIAAWKSIGDLNNYVYYLLLFLVLSYISSCWWSWTFGCSFGMRNMAEFYSLFAFIFIPFVSSLLKKKLLNQVLVFGFLVLVVALNIQLSYSYGGCFSGENDWDFAEYFRLVNDV